MIDCAYRAVMPYEAIFAYRDASPVLKRTTHVDKRASPYGDILTAISVEWRKQTERIIERFPEQFRHEPAKLIRLMIGGVDTGGESESTLAHSVHHKVHFASGHNKIARGGELKKLFFSHNSCLAGGNNLFATITM